MAAENITTIAAKEIGTAESPSGSNCVLYNTWFYGKKVSGPQYPWCGTFVSWCYNKAGYPLGNIGYLKGYAGVSTAIEHFTQTGEITAAPAPGDIFFIGFKTPGIFEHTGIFVKDNSDKLTFTSIEGNTSAANGNQANGGETAQKVRPYKMSIFAHPKMLDKT